MTCDGWWDIGCHLSNFAAWLKSAWLWCFEHTWGLILSALASVLEAIPVPSFVATLQTNLGAFPPGILYFANVFQLKAGFAMILSAYVIRFGIRRLPVVG